MLHFLGPRLRACDGYTRRHLLQVGGRPGLGALVSHLDRRGRPVPPAVTLPRWNRFLDLPNDYAGEKAGFLGGGSDPWLVRPLPDGLSFGMEGLALPPDVPPGRLADRRD